MLSDSASTIVFVMMLMAVLGCFVRLWLFRLFTYLFVGAATTFLLMNVVTGHLHHPSTRIAAGVIGVFLLCMAIKLVALFGVGSLRAKTDEQIVTNGVLNAQRQLDALPAEGPMYSHGPTQADLAEAYERGRAIAEAEFQGYQTSRPHPAPPPPPAGQPKHR